MVGEVDQRGVSPMIGIVILTVTLGIAFGVIMYRRISATVIPLNAISDQAAPRK